jgi:two-component system chemotaxis response regulator CheB
LTPYSRSAALEFGERVIGVILSGTLGDGVTGLQAIKRAGGITVVQDPQEALFPEMPTKAIENVEIDYVLSLQKIATRLVRLTSKTPVSETANQMGENENQTAAYVKGRRTIY